MVEVMYDGYMQCNLFENFLYYYYYFDRVKLILYFFVIVIIIMMVYMAINPSIK